MEVIYSKADILEKRSILLEKEVLKEYENEIRRTNENFFDGYSHYSFDVKGVEKANLLKNLYSGSGYTSYLEEISGTQDEFILNIAL